MKAGSPERKLVQLYRQEILMAWTKVMAMIMKFYIMIKQIYMLSHFCVSSTII